MKVPKDYRGLERLQIRKLVDARKRITTKLADLDGKISKLGKQGGNDLDLWSDVQESWRLLLEQVMTDRGVPEFYTLFHQEQHNRSGRHRNKQCRHYKSDMSSDSSNDDSDRTY